MEPDPEEKAGAQESARSGAWQIGRLGPQLDTASGAWPLRRTGAQPPSSAPIARTDARGAWSKAARRRSPCGAMPGDRAPGVARSPEELSRDDSASLRRRGGRTRGERNPLPHSSGSIGLRWCSDMRRK